MAPARQDDAMDSDDDDYDTIFKSQPASQPEESTVPLEPPQALPSSREDVQLEQEPSASQVTDTCSTQDTSTAVASSQETRNVEPPPARASASLTVEESTNILGASISSGIVSTLQPFLSNIEQVLRGISTALSTHPIRSVSRFPDSEAPAGARATILPAQSIKSYGIVGEAAPTQNLQNETHFVSNHNLTHDHAEPVPRNVKPPPYAAPLSEHHGPVNQDAAARPSASLPQSELEQPHHDSLQDTVPASQSVPPLFIPTAERRTRVDDNIVQTANEMRSSLNESFANPPLRIAPQPPAPVTPLLFQATPVPYSASREAQYFQELGMRTQPPTPLLSMLSSDRAVLTPRYTDDAHASVYPDLPMAYPARDLLGKRAAEDDISVGQAQQRLRLNDGSRLVQERHMEAAVATAPSEVIQDIPAAVPTRAHSTFLPQSMLRTTSAPIRRQPLSAVEAADQLIKDLAGLPFYVSYEIFRLANCYLPVEDVIARQKELLELRKACEALRSQPGYDVLLKLIESVRAFLPREERHSFLIKTKVWQALLDEKSLRSKGDAMEIGNPKDMKDNSYGGKVRYRAVITTDSGKIGSWKAAAANTKRPHLAVELKAPAVAVSNSNRLTKLYGSEAFLAVKLDDPSLKRVSPAYLLESLQEGIRIGNDLYHAWFIKDGTALLINTSLRFEYEETKKEGSDEFFLWFIDRHNPPEMNQGQTVGKWAKRMQLLWSASKPGPRLEVENIQMIEDIVAPSYKHLPKPPAERDMTDGAGLMSLAVAQHIKERFNLRWPPCAVQHRTAGFKGMYVLQTPESDVPGVDAVWLRPSQHKIKYRPDQLEEPANRTIDVLSVSQFTAPARITTQLIVLLAENGVPNHILVDLMTKSLKLALNPFFSRKSKPCNMASALEELCAMATRRLSRAGGLLRGTAVEEGAEEEEDEYEDHPPSYEESAYHCLLSGFTLSGSVYLRRKVKDILTGLIKETARDIRFRLDRSVDGRIVPDPTGKLKPGEIFVQFRREYDLTDTESAKILTGPVLITRHPCKLPTDIQKMQAVDVEELRYLYDVIVMSIQGDRSPASMLGGGDYDGDRATVIWEPKIVEPFKNADPSFADQPPNFEDCLDKDSTTVASLLAKMEGWSAREKRIEIQKYLLCDLESDYQMQGYSNRHDVALYLLGASHPKTVEFAHKYMVSLDSAKTGVKVKPAVYSSQEDRQYDREHPWKPQDDKGAQKFALGPRPARLGPFVLDDFKRKASELETKLLQKYDKMYIPKGANGVAVLRDYPLDEDLCRPWREFEARLGPEIVHIKQAIQDHVKESFSKFKLMNQEYAKAMDAGTTLTRTRTERMQEIRDFYRNGLPEHIWKRAMSARELETIKASYCYLWEMGQHSNKRGDFPFEVAHYTLCNIKAEAHRSGAVTVTNMAYKHLRMDNRMVKTTNPLPEYDDD